VIKADKIFDPLLQQGQIKLSHNHSMQSTEELKKIRRCKWHSATSHMTLIIVRCFDSRSNQKLSKGGSSLTFLPKLQSRWRLIKILSPLIRLKCLQRMHCKPSCWHLNRLKIKELSIPKYKQPLLMSKENGCWKKGKRSKTSTSVGHVPDAVG
jgi:hypothetical protein